VDDFNVYLIREIPARNAGPLPFGVIGDVERQGPRRRDRLRRCWPWIVRALVHGFIPDRVHQPTGPRRVHIAPNRLDAELSPIFGDGLIDQAAAVAD
jgi:hypothetical protein